jgi:phosphoglycolate phosphatase
MGVDIHRVVMVGDSNNDVQAARNAGCSGVVAVPYGYNHGDDIRAAEPDLVIDSLAELSAFLNKAA